MKFTKSHTKQVCTKYAKSMEAMAMAEGQTKPVHLVFEFPTVWIHCCY